MRKKAVLLHRLLDNKCQGVFFMQFSVFGYDLTLSELIALGCSLFLTVFYAVKTRGLKNIIKEVVEYMKKYKFKTESSVEETKGQDFSSTKPVYRLNKATNELEKTDEKVDLQEIINSGIELALDHALDRLLPKIQEAQDVAQLDLMREDLDFAMETCNRAEEYREKFNLDSKLSVQDIFAHVAKQAEILDAKIKQAQSTKKEGVENEKKTDEEKE